VTASTLLLYIILFLGLQILLGVVYGLTRQSSRPATLVALDTTQRNDRPNLAWNGFRAFRVARRAYEDAAQTQCSFYLEPVDGLPLPAFKPGQFLTFSLLYAAKGAAARKLIRCYSLSERPTPDQYRVTIKRALAPAQPAGLPAGAASSYFHDHVHAGSTLQIGAPSGRFHLNAESDTPVVLIAGGIGITPMMCMLRWCAQHQPQRVVHLFYGVRNSAEHAFKAVLEEMALKQAQLRLHTVYSKPLPEDGQGQDYQHTGYVDLALLKKTLRHVEHEFYICGPAAMMACLVPDLAAWGVASADIHFEAFGPATVSLPADVTQVQGQPVSAPISVHFQRSGRTLSWSGQKSNLLDFAEAHGIQVESGCRSGSCGSCVSTLVYGTVGYDRSPDFDLAPGQCLLCVGKPLKALALDT
jgi:ferredoxin-NADP reductase